MSGRARRLLAAGCALLACAGCALALAAHLRPGAFSQTYAPAPRALRRAVAPAATARPDGPVDVNRDDAQALCALPGVGPVIAAAIVADREANGPFDFPEDLLAVPGIGPKTLAGLSGWLDTDSFTGLRAR
ncbi:MAG: helix-hairpin-helix domain-containing protein [Clostridiales bacterium]|nr:helix-hairpin-helix domain-containing protein [Clostridiales bacterium]